MVLEIVLGSSMPPSAIGPYSIDRGKWILSPRELHLNEVSILSIRSRSFRVLLIAISGYKTPGSKIVVTAVHLSVLESLLCFIFPMYVVAMSWHLFICWEQLPSGAKITPRVRLPSKGS